MLDCRIGRDNCGSTHHLPLSIRPPAIDQAGGLGPLKLQGFEINRMLNLLDIKLLAEIRI